MIAVVVLAACSSGPRRDGRSPGDDEPVGVTGVTGATGDTGPPPPPAAVEVRFRPGQPCADPSARAAAPFRVEAGPYVEESSSDDVDGGGVAVGDFDGDGLLEVLVLGHLRDEYLDQTAPGVFDAVATGYRDPEIDLSLGLGAAVADYDADGDLDVFVTRYRGSNVLLQNDGAGHFRDVAAAAGVAGAPEHLSAAPTFSDHDNDGDLDLFVPGHGETLRDGAPAPVSDRDYFYVNEGDGTFTDASDRIPEVIHVGRGLVPVFVDLDDDGWRDLYVATDFYDDAPAPCILAWNREGTFVPDHEVGLDVHIAAMGLGIDDLNDDGKWDFLLPEWRGVDLLLSSAAGVWIDWADARGLVPDEARGQVVAWGGELADVDNDGDADAIVVFGGFLPDRVDNPGDQPDALWLQEDDGRFVDVAPAWGFDHPGVGRGLAVVDLDLDGWLDVIVPDLVGPTRVYRAACGDEAWIEVALEQPGTANPDAVGAVVEVTAGGRTRRKPVLAGGTGFGTGLPPVVHFGLGEHELVERLVVRWPDGARTELVDVAVRQELTLVRAP